MRPDPIEVEKIMVKTVSAITVLCAALALGACGNHQGERALSGAGIGAATGAVLGAVAGSPAVGAAVGGAAGAAIGGLTTKRDVDLGDPAWK